MFYHLFDYKCQDTELWICVIYIYKYQKMLYLYVWSLNTFYAEVNQSKWLSVLYYYFN